MVRYNNKNWFSFLLSGTRHMLPGMMLSMSTIGAVTAIICTLQFVYKVIDIEFSLTIHGLLGVVLGLLLVFRTNTAYDRWWEGRKLLGNLVNVSRFFAITTNSFFTKDEEAGKQLLVYLDLFINSFKHHMLNEPVSVEMEMIRPEHAARFQEAGNKPNYVLLLISQKISEAYQQNKLTGEELLVLQRSVGDLTDILGGCERIKKTPIPFAYAIHLKRVVFFYIITLPFGLIHDLHWWSIPLVMFMFFTLVGIELIAEEIEDPFGKDDNDLPMKEIILTIEKNLNEIAQFTDDK